MEVEARADVRIILEHQHPGGAYVASPGYSQYPYCWLRDGSFVAHAMDVAGEQRSAAQFHAWVVRAVLGIEPAIRTAIRAADAGEAVDHDRMPPARFTLEGRVEEDAWPNFQVDGYGQWLWSLREHARTGVPLDAKSLDAVELVAAYLVRFWNEPCFDAWEEGRTQHHTSTLASACAGLRAAAELLAARSGGGGSAGDWGSTGDAGRACADSADAAWRSVLERCVVEGRFRKAVRSTSVDASLVWLATPFQLVDADDVVFVRTLERIERDLVCDGGVLRYPEDTFYGGGAWILLTAWLAWHHARTGRIDRARPYLAWVEQQRCLDGGLPEQVPCSRTEPWFLGWWTRRWGPSATPLLWSHAMTLLASTELAHAGSVVDGRLPGLP